MKRIAFVFLFFLFNCGLCLAYENPRWGTFPLSVYIEPHAKKPLVEKAFATWQNSSGIAKFRYVSSERQYPNITVKFTDKNPYKTGEEFERAIGLTHSYTPLRFYATAKVVIYLTHPGTDKPLSDDMIYETALHEIGHAMGLAHSNAKEDIMYPVSNGQTELSTNDLTRFKKIYTP